MNSSDLKRRLVLVYALGAITVGMLFVVMMIIVNGTDEDDAPAIAQEQRSEGTDGHGESSGKAPPLRTVAVERSEGKDASVSAASPSLERPTQIWLRISAAPKQAVSGSWNVSCGSDNVAMDAFAVTPPHLMKLEVPGDDPQSCIVRSSAQLKESGRVKLAILRDR